MFKFLETLAMGDAFNTRIKITFINHLDNLIIHEAEYEQYQLPEDFQTVDTLILNNKGWKIIFAEPAHANQYTLDKKITLRLNPLDLLKFKKMIDHPAEGTIHFGKSRPPIK